MMLTLATKRLYLKTSSSSRLMLMTSTLRSTRWLIWKEIDPGSSLKTSRRMSWQAHLCYSALTAPRFKARGALSHQRSLTGLVKACFLQAPLLGRPRTPLEAAKSANSGMDLQGWALQVEFQTRARSNRCSDTIHRGPYKAQGSPRPLLELACTTRRGQSRTTSQGLA